MSPNSTWTTPKQALLLKSVPWFSPSQFRSSDLRTSSTSQNPRRQMQTVGLLILAMQAASAVGFVQCDLFYSTSTSCADLALPLRKDLHAQLLSKELLSGTAFISETSSATGCVLHVEVDGEPSNAAGGAISLASHVDESLEKLVATQGLRGAKGVRDLKLERLRVRFDNRDYSIDSRAVGESATGEVTLNGDECADFNGKALLEDLLPSGPGEVVVAPGLVDIAKCTVGLDILGQAPPFASAKGAVAFLKSLDQSVNDWFSGSSPKQSAATLKTARLAFSSPKTTALDSSEGFSRSHVNPPSKQITVGILVGLTVLCSMLVGVAYLKRRHEHKQQIRYSNASRAAQIRRVSYRMGYQPDYETERHLDAEEEEKEGLL